MRHPQAELARQTEQGSLDDVELEREYREAAQDEVAEAAAMQWIEANLDEAME